MDGTQFSVTNTPQILASLSKAASRRLKATFAKIGAVVLVELGLHNPLAAEIGADGESEMTLAKRLLSRLPAKSLLIANRCYGVRAFLSEFLTVLQDASCAYLVRVRSNLKPRLIERLPDGSTLMEIKAQKGRKAILMREIRVACAGPKVLGWMFVSGPTCLTPRAIRRGNSLPSMPNAGNRR